MTTYPLADAVHSLPTASDGRPEFLMRMGLMLPCSVEDVEAAYRDRAKIAHPDAGGSTSEFTRLQADYEAALEYARFHASRRGWLAANVDRYAAQQEVIAEIERLGGSVETERRPAWITHEIGEDFAQLLEVITAVRLTGPAVSLAEVEYLAGQGEILANLHRLDLSDSRVDYAAVRYLAAFPTLHELDLSGTYAGNRAAAMLARLPTLRRVNLADTFVSWLARLELRRRNPGLEIITRRDGARGASSAPVAKRGYRWLFRALLAYVAILILATHTPEEPDFVEDLAVPGADKLVHVAIYCGLSFLLAFWLSFRSADRRSQGALSAAHYTAIAVFVATFAAFDEFTQPWTGRRRDLLDWLADLVGLAVGLLLFTAYQAYTRKRRPASLYQD